MLLIHFYHYATRRAAHTIGCRCGEYRGNVLLSAVFFMVIICSASHAGEAVSDSTVDTLVGAITGGRLNVGVRYRYEHVNDDAAEKNANAATVRTVLGYKTAPFLGLSARLAFQDVRKAGPDDFNDATGRPGAKTQFAVVADPSDTDILEGYAAYTGLLNTTITAGRQIITVRNAPLHRFLGTVLWRQNWQTHDAVSLENRSLPDTVLRYAYTWNINRIFSEKAAGARANFDSDSHLFNARYDGLPWGRIEAYAYLLDFSNSPVNSTATYGLRFNGPWSWIEGVDLLYAAEFAHQADHAGNPAGVSEEYFLGEVGVVFKALEVTDSLMLKVNYELLSGNGAVSFRTPLATGHAFQGWADRFLVTPRDGIEDLYFTLGTAVAGFNLMLVYHDLSSDHDSYDYGAELDIQLTRKFGKHFTLGLKYSDYDADRNPLNIARNGNIALDARKFWTWLEFRYP